MTEPVPRSVAHASVTRSAAGLAVARSALLLDAVSAVSSSKDEDTMLQGLAAKLRWLIGFVRLDFAKITNSGDGYRLRTLFAAGADTGAHADETLPIGTGPAAALFASEREWLAATVDPHEELARSILSVRLDGEEGPHGGLIFTFAPDGPSVEEIDAARIVGRHLAFALTRISIMDRLHAEVERRTLAEAQLQQAVAFANAENRAKDDFLAMVSHELRTPLGSLVGWVAMLRAGTVPAREMGKVLDSLDRNVKLQTRLVGDLVDASRIVSGCLELVVAECDLRNVLADAIETARAFAEVRDVALSMTLPQDSVRCVGDQQRLQQVVANLLSNAIKFSTKGQAVHIRMDCSEGNAVISVRDEGRGIDPAFMPFIFEPFRQEQTGTTRTVGGLGLGLTIARHIVELHRGTLRAESAGRGFGTTMTVRLPFVVPATAT
jgi:signal transduction histidine kinase